MLFEGIVNARDLGGLRVGGKTVRSGLLLRTGHLHDATDADVARLRDEYHLRRIFDFRTMDEAAAQPDRPVPGSGYQLLPTLDIEAERQSGEAVPAETWLDLPSHIVRLAFSKVFQQKARELYPSLVMSDFSQLQYAAFLNTILDTPDGAVLWHCSQGKDRTGIGAAVILGALGADRETIVADFDLSNESYATAISLLSRKVQDMGGNEEALKFIGAMVGVSRENFERALDLIDAQYGSLSAYLVGPLGFGPADQQRLREKYLL